MENINNILIHLKNIFKLKEDKQIAQLLGINFSNLSKMKQRNKIPYEELFLLAEKENIDINLIIYGKNTYNDVKKIDYENEIRIMIHYLKEDKKEYYYHKIKDDILKKE